MSTPKPVFFIVPGGWHPSSCYETLATCLKEAADVEVVIGSVPSLKSTQPLTASCTQDAEAIRQMFLTLIEGDGKDVLVINHSYGGVPGGGAAHSLSKVSRVKANKKGGIIGLVYMSSFLVPEGVTLVDFLGGAHPRYVLRDQPSEGFCKAGDVMNYFYHDVESSLAHKMEGSLQPQALQVFESAAPPPAWKEPDFQGRLAYLRCTEDRALPLFIQDLFMDKSGVKWLVKDIKASHSPFVSRPEEVTEYLLQWANEFSKLN